MELYDYIFKRRSIRKFQPEALSPGQIVQIMKFAGEVKPLFPEIAVRMELAAPEDTKGMVSANAPHYLMFYSKKAEGYRMNAGFMLQQMDLFFASLGLGSCWLGMAKTARPPKDDMDYVIMLAFGKAQENPCRENVSQFKRRELSQIASGSDERLEAVRLAPSATNSQPWYFVCRPDCIYVYRHKLGALKALMYDSMNRIDMGIALCHLWLASEAQGCSFSFSADTGNAPAVNGYQCIGSVR